MKKVLIIAPAMFLGGVERSLLGLLEEFDYNKYQVDLFLFRREGELIKYIPRQVNLLPEKSEYTVFDRPIKDILKSRLFGYGILRILSKLVKKGHCLLSGEKDGVWKSMQYTSAFVSLALPKINGEYDLALSFQGVPFYMSKVTAKKKLAWIHTDYSILYPDKKMDRKAFALVDKVVHVSEKCEDAFLNIYPDHKGKSMVVENVLSKRLVFGNAEEADVSSEMQRDGSVRLCSIGRFCEAKNFDNVPDICKRILDAGVNVHWYLIGYGGDENLIRQKIKESGMEEHVIILGKKENPYPYIKECDIYVQPSRYEGKCVAVREAQMLHKPVIITRYATSPNQLEEGVDGVIVPMDNKGCAEGILAVLKDEMLREKLIEHTKGRDYSNAVEIEKIYEFVEKN